MSFDEGYAIATATFYVNFYEYVEGYSLGV